MLVGGLVIVALHQCWRRGAAVIVFCYGLAFPTAFMSTANSVLELSALRRTVCVCLALIGLYLTYEGWMSAPSQSMTSQGTSSTTDWPRAA